MGTKVYDSNEVVCVLGAAIIDSGRADGEFVSVEQNEDAYTKIIGSDGEVTRSKTNDESGRVTLTLSQTSDSNDILSGFHAADKLAPSGTSVLPLMIKDNNGTTLFAAEHAWIVRYPTTAFGKESDTREWLIDCAILRNFVGGSSDI